MAHVEPGEVVSFICKDIPRWVVTRWEPPYEGRLKVMVMGPYHVYIGLLDGYSPDNLPSWDWICGGGSRAKTNL